jgi:hypothetical protein
VRKGRGLYNILLLLVSSFAIATLALVTPYNLQAKATEQIITFSGQKITSIFDGLSPSHFALVCAPSSPWQNYGKCASGEEVCGTGKMAPPAGESGD